MTPRRGIVMAVAVPAVMAGVAAVWFVRAERGTTQGPAEVAARAAATAAAGAPAGEQPVAVVNGEPIGSGSLRAMLAVQPFNAAQGVPTATPQQIVDGLVKRALLRQEARRWGVECDNGQTRAFIDAWREHTPEEARRREADARGVPLDQLETDPEFVAMMRGFCSEAAVKKAIAAERPDLPADEAVARFVADLRARSQIVVNEEAVEAVAREVLR